ncbi:MAG: alpha/beta hydrolase [Chloroflexi bacterium]|nr:alpha/beta hydrolase [Chloroflexota bacterium]
MSISLRSRFWRFVLRKTIQAKYLTIAEYRANGIKTAKLMGSIPKGISIDKFEIDGIPTEWISPADANQDKSIIHLHGGGYVTGGIDSHQSMCILMAQTLKIKVLLPEYRLAPEHPFPAALEDALKVYRWLLAQGYQPGNIIISGDSAGGGLSLATVLSLRDSGEPLPAAVVCMSPWADLTLKGKSHITNEKAESILRSDVLNEWASSYIDAKESDHPLISPIYADFRSFPPLLIQVGSGEVLLDDSLTLAEKTKADGVDVTLKIWDELWHAWQALGDLIPESKKAFEEMSQFVNDKLKENN